jgi:hypothetical protein
MILAMVAMLAAQQTSVHGEEALRAGAPVIRQFMEEADGAYYQATPDRTHFVVWTRARRTDVGGLCARDEMRMEIAPAGAAPRRARIRALDVVHQFHVLQTEGGAPRWDVTEYALEDACAGADASHWIEAESPEDARAGVLGLLAVVRALGERESPLIRVRCPQAGCLDRQAMARRIRPLDPGDVRPSRTGRCGGNGRYRCLRVFISDEALCGGWALEMESGWEEPFRLRSATFIQRAGIAIHCYGEDS